MGAQQFFFRMNFVNAYRKKKKGRRKKPVKLQALIKTPLFLRRTKETGCKLNYRQKTEKFCFYCQMSEEQKRGFTKKVKIGNIANELFKKAWRDGTFAKNTKYRFFTGF